ncbi:MAG TPA: AI-2E family transporter [Chloroflexota bacterium]|jgi:predicted PurR-regulated permease PerM|nr:AI-2E family transporter [Chloroflexota bacterium]
MKNANWTRILTILLSLLALYALLAVLAGILQRFIVPVLLVIMASILAFILTPVVDFFQNRFHIFRWMSILTTYLLVGVILGTLGYFMTSPLVAQTRALADAIKNPTHLANVLSVRTTAEKLSAQASAMSSYYLAWGQGIRGYGLCSPIYFYGEAAAQGTTTHCDTFWPITVGPHWRKKLGPTLPALVRKLTAEVNDLGQTTVAANHGHSTAQIPTTKVPPSFAKPLKADLAKLSTLVSQTSTSLSAGQFSSVPQPLFGQTTQNTTAVEKNAKSLYSLVASTPIIILALQNGIDSHHLPIDVRKLLGSAVGKLRSQGTSLLNNAVTILTSTINIIFDLLIVIIMSLYLLADGGRFIRWIMHLTPERHREQAWFFVESLNKVLGGYIRGQLIVAITIGFLAGVGCYIIGVPYALLLGIFAFLAESIPVVGPILASIPAILVSLFTLSPLRTIIVVGWFLLIQQFEQNVVGPRITGRAVGIHPVAAMIAVIIGLEIGGFWGAFLAVPVTGMLFVIVAQAYSYLILRKPLPTAEIPEAEEPIDDATQIAAH